MVQLLFLLLLSFLLKTTESLLGQMQNFNFETVVFSHTPLSNYKVVSQLNTMSSSLD